MKIMLANFTKMAGDIGGLAKVTCDFANQMLKRGHEVSVVYADEKDGAFFYDIDSSVKTIDLRLQDGKRIKYPLYLKLQRELLRTFNLKKARTINNVFFEKYLMNELKAVLRLLNPDIIISFQPAASKALLCNIKTNIPVVTMSHGDPADYFETYPVAELPALEKSAICQVLLPSFEEHITNRLPNCKTITIGNAVPQFSCAVDLNSDKETFKIIFVGRLNGNHKRPHLLIEAFSKIAQKFPEWQVELWGAGRNKEYYYKIKNMIMAKSLQNRVFIKGTTNDVNKVLKDGDIFVIPSAYEGFGLSLAEAMSVGLPAIGYRSCVAVNELIVDGENGFLCDDGTDDLARKMEELMSNKNLRIAMGANAHESMKTYAPEKIWEQWETLMLDIVKSAE